MIFPLDFRLVPAVALAGAGLVPSISTAQCVERLTASTVDLGRRLGQALATDGTRMIAGAPSAVVGGQTSAGAAHVYRDSGRGWELEGVLTAEVPQFFDRLGQAVAVEGDLVATGARYDVAGELNTGGAYVFVFDGDQWREATKLTPSDPQPGHDFGYAVAIANGRILVGADGDDQPGPGAVYVFEGSGDAWTETQKLHVPTDGHGFGMSLAADGDRFVAGGFGVAAVFRHDGVAWELEQELVAAEWVLGYGADVALDGDLAVVGGGYPNQPGGRAVVFAWVGDEWRERWVVENPNPGGAAAGFGRSVALDGDRLLAGAYLTNGEAGYETGAAYLFQLGEAGWTPTYRFDDPSQPQYGRLGYAVALSGTTSICGAPAIQADGDVVVFDLPASTRTFCMCDAQGTCFNARPLSGCANSTTFGGLLTPCGSDGAGADDLVLTATELPFNQPAMLIAGTQETLLPFGNGRLCTDGDVIRMSVDFGPTATYGPGLAAAGGFGAGETRLFQVWYRDQGGPCGQDSNLTNGVEVTYAP